MRLRSGVVKSAVYKTGGPAFVVELWMLNQDGCYDVCSWTVLDSGMVG